MTKRYIRALAAVVGAALTALPAASVYAKDKPVVGDLAPEFELAMVDGSKVTLSQLRGQVLVLNFWATWCVPCRAELPTLDAYYNARKQNGLKVIAITTEGSLPVGKLKKLFAAMHMPSARGIKGGYGPIGGAVPTNFVIDRAGKLRYAKAGAFDLDDLNKILVPLLQEPAPS